jgi:DNA-directed RNA polymerase specialized sigma subunit
MKKPIRKSVNYVDNKEMYAALVDYDYECRCAEFDKMPLPRVPEFIGHCFIQIADNFANLPSFSRYPFLEDMKSDGIINCISYVRTFDVNKGSNPFAYFTQTIRNAFINRIEIEKDNLVGRYKTYQDLQILEQVNGEEGMCGPELNDISNAFIKTHNEKKEARKLRARQLARKKLPSITDFFEEDDEE